MRFRHVLHGLLGLAAAFSAVAQTAVPQNSVRVQVNLVNVPVNVIDRHGQPVSGLHRDDFSLSEDGHPQAIRVFQASAVRPLSMVMAIDTSVSARKDLPFAKQAAADLAASLLGSDDRVELLEFAGEVKQVVPFTSDLHQLDRGLRTLRGDGPTALYAAIAQAANDLASYRGRKVIVLISDGSNSVDGIDYVQARTAALRAQASIESIILVPVDANAGRDLGGEHALIQLARDTGGQSFYADAATPIQEAMTRLSLALRSEYLLGYYPSQQANETAGFRRIQLKLTSPALSRAYRLRYRTGYYAEPSR